MAKIKNSVLEVKSRDSEDSASSRASGGICACSNEVKPCSRKFPGFDPGRKEQLPEPSLDWLAIPNAS